jgi:hypothetical protein
VPVVCTVELGAHCVLLMAGCRAPADPAGDKGEHRHSRAQDGNAGSDCKGPAVQ